MPAVAIDIGSYTIKTIHAKPGKQPVVERVIETFNSVGSAVPADEPTLERLTQVLSSLWSDNRFPTNDVRLTIPETVVSTKVIAIPPLNDAELASAIQWQAEKHIPIPPDELTLEYQVLYRPEKSSKENMRVLLVGARKNNIERYVEMFNAIGIEPTLVETQALSLVRSLGFTPEDPPTLIMHLGAQTMTLVVMRGDELQFVVSHLNGGQLLTKSISQSFSLTAEQAEQYKRTYGLDPSQFQGKVREAILTTMQVLTGEVQKSMQFYANQAGGQTISRVILSGGSAVMPGLVEHITEVLGVETLVAAPFASAKGALPTVLTTASFGPAMGLLMREV
ncbi:MAG: type IV pilus assembly protein PilM [Pseudomonadales bacterium]|nr:type IV pilus assembly protein PilM [Candidatus Woesebacteria bacterium]MCB9802303.1 type IV pilus assembly protein PilM [Pseudomonadales bacterium]